MWGERTISAKPGMAKAQVGIEYIVLVAFLLIAITPVFLYALDSSAMSVRTARSREVVETIAIAADSICSMGGGKTSVTVYMPYGAEHYVIGNRTVKLGILIGDSVGESFARTTCNVTGNISLNEGYASIPVSMLANGTVLVGGP